MAPLPDYCHNSSLVEHKFANYFVRSTIVLEAPCASFAVYCICKLTPKHLMHAKLLLLAHQLWILFYSSVVCIGLVPVDFFPYIAFYSNGLFDYFEVDMTIVIYLLGTGFGGMLFSILCLFVYRHQSVLPETHPLKFRPKPFTLLCLLIHSGTILFMTPLIVKPPDQQTSLVALQSAFTNPPCDLWRPRLFIYWFGVLDQLIGYLLFLTVCSLLMVFFVVHSFRIIRAYQRHTSKSTRKRQIGFLYALTLMASIPNLFLFAPTMTAVLSSIGSDSYDPVVGCSMVCLVSLHGSISTITMVLSHKPYRKEVVTLMNKAMFWRKEKPKRFVIQCDATTKTAKY